MKDIQRFAQIWSQSRYDGNKTQEEMAFEMEVSRQTIQNWEKGLSAPNLYQGTKWFNILNVSPLKYYLAYLYPNMDFLSSQPDTEENIDLKLNMLISNMSYKEKEQMLYLMSGHQGGSWYGLLQMMVAHCHTNMRARVNAANLICNNFEMDTEMNSLSCPDEIMPDIALLKRAIHKGKKAVIEGKSEYTAIEEFWAEEGQ